MSRRHLLLRICLLLCLYFAAAPAAVFAGSNAADAFAFETEDAAVREGARLEAGRQWLDAVDHYEAAFERWPDNNKLKYGLRRSKIHFGVSRRYEDASFETDLLGKSKRDALLLFDDVFRQVHSNYVDALTATSFVAHGTESFYLALANPKFLRFHLSDVDPNRVRNMRRILRDDYWNKGVANVDQAYNLVDGVCRIAKREVGLDAGAVVMEYIFGGCNALDDYSHYLTPDRLDDLYGNIEGEFVGLGIEMKAVAGKGLLMVYVLPDSPAEESGIQTGDHITAIDGRDCRQMTTDEAARLLRGPSGSRIRLRVQTAAAERDCACSRRAVVVKSIPVARIIDRRNGVGYIRMTGFQRSSAEELDAALAGLKRQGMRSLIWDVRGNPGGLLTAAVEVLDRFIEEGTLVSTRGRSRDQNWTYSAHRTGTWDVPLVLLVDGDSASASEIVAGAIADHRRGSVVGRKTYGKWSVQSIFPIRGETGLRLTTAKFYSPDGHTYGKVGLAPDVTVSQSQTTLYRGNRLEDLVTDADVRKGMDVLQERYTQR